MVAAAGTSGDGLVDTRQQAREHPRMWTHGHHGAAAAGRPGHARLAPVTARHMSLRFARIAIIGFGEAGSLLGEDLVRSGRDVVSYDLLLDEAQGRQELLERAERAGVRARDSTPAAVRDADLVISAVTASAAVEVATLAATALHPGQIYLDINSVSPATKQQVASSIERSGADFIEAAVMAPVPPQRLAVPMLLGGRRAGEVAQALRALGMNCTAIAERIGVAAA